MVCENCGQTIDKKMIVCPYCGKSVIKEKKKKNKLVFLIILLIFICLLSFVLFTWLKNKNNKEYGEVSNIEEITYTYNDNNIPKFINGSFSTKKVNNKDEVLNALNDIKELLKINDPTKELLLDYQETDNEITYYRFNQIYNNIPVLNQNIIVSVDKNGNILSYSGYYIPDININISPKLTKNNINDIFLNEMGNDSKVLNNNLYIWDNNGSQDLVYVINGYSNSKIAEYIIEANTGEILSENDAINSANVYSYTGVGMDNKSYTINLEEFYDIGRFKPRYKFYDSIRKISIADSRYVGPIMGSLMSALPGSTPIEVNLVDGKIDMTWENEKFIQNAITTMANYETIYDYYKNVLGRNSFDNKGSEIIVNLGITESTFSSKDLMNAFWSNLTNQMFIGNYNGKSFSASLDVLGHEFTHGVVSFTSKFASTAKKSDQNKAFETGALNEGYADVLGSLIEGKNWTMAESNEVIRSAINPTAYKNAAIKGEKYYYPDGYLTDGRTLEEFLKANNLKNVTDYDNGGVHQNSNVVYHAAYLMYNAGAFKSREEMAKVWYKSLLSLSSYSDFEDCAIAVISAANALGLDDSSIYKITQAFIDTKMLDKKSFNIRGTIKSGKELIDDVSINIYSYGNNTLIKSLKSDKTGNYNIDLQTGIYEFKFSKKGFEDLSVIVIINGDKALNITLKNTEVKKENTSLKNACKSDNCYNFTIYYLDSKNNKLVENYQTYAIEAGTTFDINSLLKSVNKTLGSNMITTDGKSFYVNVAGFKVECGWYYKDTDVKFDWTKPINEDIEIEMKLFEGSLGNDDLTNIFDLFN